MAKRWGKKFVDKRDWKEYNEELVVRGEFYLDLDWAKSWDKELEEMNRGKRGAQFEFPESLIRLQAVWYQWIDYRGLEGITRKLSERGLVPAYNDHSTINRRVNKTSIGFELPKEGLVCASTDGTGMKIGNAGSYREHKYRNKDKSRKKDKRKRYVKVIITANPNTKDLLACDVSIEGEGDSEPDAALKHVKQLEENGNKIEQFWGDSALDDRGLINHLAKGGAKIAIKPRRLDTSDAPDSQERKKLVDDFNAKGYRKWAKGLRYGLRWVGTEGIFSAVKRKFGERLRSKGHENMCFEAKRKFWAYETMRKYAIT
jgi:hypothetical protein